MSHQTEKDDHPMEAHRALARELERRAQSIYSSVGAFTLAAALAPAGVTLARGASLLDPVPWLLGLTLALVVLLAGRSLVRARIEALRERVAAYCATNGLSAHEWTRYYAREGTYSFLAGVLEDAPNDHG